MIECIATHTVDTSLFTPGGWVLDAGSRDFDFARYAVSRGCRVLALDPDPMVIDPQIEGVTFRNLALGDSTGSREFALHEVLEARHLATACRRLSCPYVTVQVVTIADLMSVLGIASWDCVKMDIEGSEYEILRDWRPIAKQVTVEFHDHVEKRSPEVYEQIFARMAEWYSCPRLYAGDTLFTLKEYGHAETTEPQWWRS